MTYVSFDVDIDLSEISDYEFLQELKERFRGLRDGNKNEYMSEILKLLRSNGSNVELYFKEQETLKRVLDNLDQFTEEEFITFLNNKNK